MNLFNEQLQAINNSEPVLKVRNYYEQLADRDQLAVLVLGLFLLFVVLVTLLIMPSQSYFNAGMQKYRASVETLEWMKANKHLVDTNQVRSSLRDTGQSLLGVANQSSKRFRITFKRYEPVGDNGLRLWVEGASFNNVVLWLEQLNKNFGINVTEIAVDKQDQPGTVNVRLELQG